MAIMTGEKAAFYCNQVNRVFLANYSELSLEKVLPMMEEDPDVWKYMVDRGERKKPRWNRQYAFTVLATIKPKFVK